MFGVLWLDTASDAWFVACKLAARSLFRLWIGFSYRFESNYSIKETAVTAVLSHQNWNIRILFLIKIFFLECVCEEALKYSLWTDRYRYRSTISYYEIHRAADQRRKRKDLKLAVYCKLIYLNEFSYQYSSNIVIILDRHSWSSRPGLPNFVFAEKFNFLKEHSVRFRDSQR